MEWEELSPEERLLLLRGALLGWAHESADGLKRLPPKKPDPRGEDTAVTMARVREAWAKAEARRGEAQRSAAEKRKPIQPIREWKGGRG